MTSSLFSLLLHSDWFSFVVVGMTSWGTGKQARDMQRVSGSQFWLEPDFFHGFFTLRPTADSDVMLNDCSCSYHTPEGAALFLVSQCTSQAFSSALPPPENTKNWSFLAFFELPVVVLMSVRARTAETCPCRVANTSKFGGYLAFASISDTLCTFIKVSSLAVIKMRCSRPKIKTNLSKIN